MFGHPLRVFIIGATAALGAATQAAAGGCCPTPSPCACAPAVQYQVVPPLPEMLVVNQGPVYSGPGAYVTQRNFIEGNQTAPYGYPYVGYVYADTYVGGYRSFYSGNFYRGRSPYAYVGPVRYKRYHSVRQPVRALASVPKPHMVTVAAAPRR